MALRIYQRSAFTGMLIGLLSIMLWAGEGPVPAVTAPEGSAESGLKGLKGTVPFSLTRKSGQSAADDLQQTLTVSKTFNNAPFDYSIKFLSRRDGYRVYQIKFPSPVKTSLKQNNTVPAEYYLPDGLAPGDYPNFRLNENGTVPLPLPRRPAVICMHILDGNDALTDLVCSVLALRGVPAIMFRLPYYGERGLPDGPMALAKDPQLFTNAVAQAGEDVRRTIDLLASRSEVDPDRIGITGISLGGIIAATAAGGETRINRAALILSGGDLMSIIHHARETRPLSAMIQKLPPDQRGDLEDKIAAVDPLRFAPALREKARQGKVIMINAAEDEVIPRASIEKLAAAMEISDRVVWLQGLGHYTSMAELPRVLRMTADFFAQDLPPGTKPPVVENKATPVRILAQVLAQAAAILENKPEVGRCQMVDFTLTIQPKNQPQAQVQEQSSQKAPIALGATTNVASVGEGAQEGRFRLVRGSQGKFAFYCKLPTGTEISLGQNNYPWMATGGKEVIEGSENPGPALKDPLELLDARQVALVRMLAGVLNSISLAPDVLERLIAVKDEGIIEGVRVMQITSRGKIPGSVRLMLKGDANTPQSLTFNISGVEGNIKFHGWQINAAAGDALFQPPAELPRRKVDESFLYTLFATSLKYILGSAG